MSGSPSVGLNRAALGSVELSRGSRPIWKPSDASAVCVLEARGLRKAFGQGDARVEALRGVDVRVGRGELVAIMGRSGSGKSTLLTLLGGIDVPTEGQVLLEGTDLATLSDDQRTLIRRHRIGFIFQSFNLLPILTAEENVALPLELDGVPAAEARRRAAEGLEMVGMSARRHHIPSTLSGGEQQRVAVARALAIQPAILLADEPTGNLDSANGQRLMDMLRKLVDERQQTIVMVTHDSDVAAKADRVIFLRDGLVEDEPRMPVTTSIGIGLSALRRQTANSNHGSLAGHPGTSALAAVLKPNPRRK